VKSKYAILCSSRSGSTHLCDLLRSTKRAGDPQEFFNRSLNFNHLLNGKGFVDGIVNGTKTENDVFGAKLVGLDQLSDYADSTLEFTHCIYLKRRDVVAQAVSRYKSWKTGVWHLNDKHKKIPKTHYCFDGIKWCYDAILEESRIFESILSEAPYLEVCYEDDLINNPEQTIYCILEHMNISTKELPLLNSGQKKVSDKDSVEWAQMFASEIGLGGRG
jgi:LPS sulfotransferase NodH